MTKSDAGNILWGSFDDELAKLAAPIGQTMKYLGKRFGGKLALGAGLLGGGAALGKGVGGLMDASVPQSSQMAAAGKLAP